MGETGMYKMPEWDVSDPIYEMLMQLRQSWEAIYKTLSADLDALHTTLFQIGFNILVTYI